MSLINDALKRAKQAHQETAKPAPPIPHFRPVEQVSSATRHQVGLMVPVALFLVALVTLLALWELWKKEGSPKAPVDKAPLNVAARTPGPEKPQTVAASSDVSSSAPTTTINPAASASIAGAGLGKVAMVPDHAAAGAPVAALASATTNLSAATPVAAATNQATASEPDAAVPAPLKLQGIVFNPKKPSALINGRVMFVGDRIRDFHITAIHQDEVVLTGGGQTRVLRLEP
jgi:hypothetical protein